MIYTEYGSLLRLNVAISGFLRYLWLKAKYGLRQTSESRFLTLVNKQFLQKLSEFEVENQGLGVPRN